MHSHCFQRSFSETQLKHFNCNCWEALEVNSKECHYCNLKCIFEQFMHLFNLCSVWCHPNYIINISNAKYFTFLAHKKALIDRACNEPSDFKMFLAMIKPTQRSLLQTIKTFVLLQDIFVVNISSCKLSWNFHVDFLFQWSLCKSIWGVHLNCCPMENDGYEKD